MVNVDSRLDAVAEELRISRPQNGPPALYEESGVTPGRGIIPRCSTGVCSSVVLLALRLIGYGDVAFQAGIREELGSHPEKATGSRG